MNGVSISNTRHAENNVGLLHPEDPEGDEKSRENCGKMYIMQYVISVMCNLGVAITYANRILISVFMTTISKSANGKEWNSRQQGVIFSAFFWSFIVSLIPSGIIATVASPHKFLAIFNLIISTITIGTPFIIRNLNYVYFVFSRILMGVGYGPVNPVVCTVIHNWSTKNTNTRMVSIAANGFNVGILLSHLLGVVSVTYFDWDISFYIIGVLGLLWSVAWWLIVTDTPETNRLISEKELQEVRRNNVTVKLTFDEIPWRTLLSNPKIWVFSLTFFCQNWCSYTLIIELPSYLVKVFKMNVAESILFSLCPPILSYILTLFGAIFIDFLISRNYVSSGFIRKITTCTAFIGNSIFMILTIHSTDKIQAIIFLSLAYGFLELNFLGFFTEIVEISGPYSAIVNSVSTSLANISGVLSPILTGILTSNNTQYEWSIVFYFVVFIDIIGCLTYVLSSSKNI